jgi:hypothetical protein
MTDVERRESAPRPNGGSLKRWRTLDRSRRTALLVALFVAIPNAGMAQKFEPLDWKGKLRFHAYNTYGPLALGGLGAYAGFLQEINSPREWGQGASGYDKRLASTAAAAGIHGVLAFGLDTALHQDPRYYRAGGTGFWRRTGHAVRGTILTRTDAGGETFSTWRVGSAYGEAFLSNLWYPARLDKPRYGFSQGSIRLGFDLVSNLGAEFWPDIKKNIFRRRVTP